MWCWSGGRGILKKKLSLCYSVVYYYIGAQRYAQFLQVGRLYQALILLGLALSSERHCVFGLHGVIYIFNIFCLHPSFYFLVSWAWWDWPLTWLTNHHPSVLWRCWLCHVTRKIVSEMTCNVSSGHWAAAWQKLFRSVQNYWRCAEKYNGFFFLNMEYVYLLHQKSRMACDVGLRSSWTVLSALWSLLAVLCVLAYRYVKESG